MIFSFPFLQDFRNADFGQQKTILCPMSSGGIDHSIYADLLKGGQSAQIQRIQAQNQIIPHNFQKAQLREQQCALQGCPHKFQFTLLPNQWIYPKYCEDHRSEHRRQLFLAAGL